MSRAAETKRIDLKTALDLARERRALIEASAFPANIGTFVEQAAEKYGDAPLWTFFEGSQVAATYKEVAAAVRRAAAALYSVGIRKGTHVSVMLPNIPEFPVCWLALAHLGAVMVPVNTRYTYRELEYVYTDSESTHLLVHSSCLAILHSQSQAQPLVDKARTIVVGEPSQLGIHFDQLLKAAADLPSNLPKPHLDDLVNIQYTSGTTGFPKGCMLTHRYWLTIGRVQSLRGTINETTKNILINSPFFYMDPQWMTLVAMQFGAQTFVAKRGSLTRFMDWLRKYRIHYCLWPGKLPNENDPDFDPTSFLKSVSTYGERRDHAAFERKFKVMARESFGMTEIGSGMFMPVEAYEKAGSGSCGIPSPFREAKLIDADGKDLGDEQVGELCIRGPGIMLGYYNKPDANARSFINGWFRTGDLFRRDSDGFYYIVGRVKDMIRRSGENIAAREVESIVEELPQVAESAAVGVKDSQRGEEVLIYVVLRDGVSRDDLPPAALLDHCSKRLAAFKVPRYVVYRSQPLPRTASEKIAKHILTKDVPDLTAGSFDRVANTWL